MSHNLKLFAGSVAGLLLLLFTAGCKTQPSHPNQLNAFDGATYNSLALAHAALSSFRTAIAGQMPQYTPVFNGAAAAYATAFDAYAAFRSQPQNTSSVAVAVGSLTAGIVSLENALINDMRAQASAAKVRSRALRFRTQQGRNLNISDILAELQLAAAIAGTIPATQPYSRLAAIVIDATSEALAAEQATDGQPIELSSIEPVALIQ